MSTRHLWTLQFRRSIVGTVLASARRQGRKTVTGDDIPRHVLWFADITNENEQRRPLVCDITWEELIALTPPANGLIRVRVAKSGIAASITSWIDDPKPRDVYRGERVTVFPEWMKPATHGEWLSRAALRYLECASDRTSLCCHGWDKGCYWLHEKNGGYGKVVFCTREAEFWACYDGDQGTWDTECVGVLPYRRWNWTEFWRLLQAAHDACVTDEEDRDDDAT